MMRSSPPFCVNSRSSSMMSRRPLHLMKDTSMSIRSADTIMLGVFAFILGVDPTYQVIEDGAWLNDTLPYGTIHRLASSGKSKGVASAVIEWCLEHCQSLRADTHADNQIMQHLLEKNGFTRCGIIHVADGTPRIAYQKLALTQQHS